MKDQKIKNLHWKTSPRKIISHFPFQQQYAMMILHPEKVFYLCADDIDRYVKNFEFVNKVKLYYKEHSKGNFQISLNEL
ncbi:hypothetical protein [Peijinzhouia sedimentorum]